MGILITNIFAWLEGHTILGHCGRGLPASTDVQAAHVSVLHTNSKEPFVWVPDCISAGFCGLVSRKVITGQKALGSDQKQLLPWLDWA